MKKEYFVVANTFAAPFVSETIYEHIEGDTPDKALFEFVVDKTDRIYAANVYKSADDFHKDGKILAKYRSRKCVKDWGE